MLKTLKLTSIVVSAVSAVVVGAVVFLGFKADSEKEAFLEKPGAIEIFKKSERALAERKDEQSLLMKQATALSKRLNPPAPKVSQSSGKRSTFTPPAKTDYTPAPRAAVNVQFDLVATAKYETAPDKSLALLKLPAEGLKWYRQGEKVGHVTIDEIREESIVYLQNENKQELFIEKEPSTTAPLLKSEVDEQLKEMGISKLLNAGKAESERENNASTAVSRQRDRNDGQISVPAEPGSRRQVGTSRPNKNVQASAVPENLPDEPSLEKQLELMDQNISEIETMIKEMGKGQSSNDLDKLVMGQLLLTLKKDRENLVEMIESGATIDDVKGKSAGGSVKEQGNKASSEKAVEKIEDDNRRFEELEEMDEEEALEKREEMLRRSRARRPRE